MSVTNLILSTLLPSSQTKFAELVAELSTSEEKKFVFAELLDLLSRLSPAEFRTAVAEQPPVSLSPYWANYLAATVEQAAAQKDVAPPSWTSEVQPLEHPVFGSELRSLRHHLLTHSPPPFSRRNLFIDTAVGGRV